MNVFLKVMSAIIVHVRGVKERNQGPVDGCYWPSALEGNCLMYWSSSYVDLSTNNNDQKWVVDFSNALIGGALSFDGYWDSFPENNVRCVRTK